MNLTSNDLDLGEMAAILGVGNHIFALFSKFILAIPMKLGGDIAIGIRGTLSANLTSNDLEFGKWQPF